MISKKKRRFYMNSVYSILNDIDTDLDEFEEEQLSDTEIKNIRGCR